MSEVESIPPPRLLDDRSMGARVMAPKRSWQEELRERIDAEKAIDQLNACVAGHVELTAVQVRSAEILLRKKLPDLASVTLQNSDGSAIRQEAGLTIIYGSNNIHATGPNSGPVSIEQPSAQDAYGTVRLG